MSFILPTKKEKWLIRPPDYTIHLSSSINQKREPNWPGPTCRVDRVGVVVHRGPALGHAGVHEGGHHHPAGVEAQHVGGVVAPLGVAGARAGRVA